MPPKKAHGKVELVIDAKASLGESPMWHADRKKLYWVDILQKRLHEFDPITGDNTPFDLSEFASCVVARKSGGLILGLQHGLAHFDFRTRRIRRLCTPENFRPEIRFNDGKCDAVGRLWVGNMHLNARANQGNLFCLDAKLNLLRPLRRLTIPNGMAWSLNDQTLFFIDSGFQCVWAFDYDLETAEISNRRVAFRIPKRSGVPDGMTIDSEGMLWVALWGGGRVVRWNPQNGKQIQTISLPVSLVTSCVFGGTKLDVLYITSARTSLEKSTRQREPLAGGVFCIKADVNGMTCNLFAG